MVHKQTSSFWAQMILLLQIPVCWDSGCVPLHMDSIMFSWPFYDSQITASEGVGVNEDVHLICLNSWSPGSRILYEGLRGMALLEEGCYTINNLTTWAPLLSS